MSNCRNVIVEQGTHDELMSQDGIYRYLNRMQMSEDPWQTALHEGP
jgi:hypothetical protein